MKENHLKHNNNNTNSRFTKQQHEQIQQEFRSKINILNYRRLGIAYEKNNALTEQSQIMQFINREPQYNLTTEERRQIKKANSNKRRITNHSKDETLTARRNEGFTR